MAKKRPFTSVEEDDGRKTELERLSAQLHQALDSDLLPFFEILEKEHVRISSTLYKKFPLDNPEHPEHPVHLIKTAVYFACFDPEPKVRCKAIQMVARSVETITRTLLLPTLEMLWEVIQALLSAEPVDDVRIEIILFVMAVRFKASTRDQLPFGKRRLFARDALYWLLCEAAIGETGSSVRRSVNPTTGL